jgi:hypothetical protein
LSPNSLRKLHLRDETHAGEILLDALEFSPALSDLELVVFPNDVAHVMHLISTSHASSHLQSIRMDVKVDSESFYESESLNYAALLRALVILKKKELCSCHIICARPNSFDFQEYLYDCSDGDSDGEAVWSRQERRYISAIRPNASHVKKFSELRNEGFCIFIGSTAERWI